MSEDYVDVRCLLRSYEEKECWNCGHTWLREARPAESICRECFMGQGDHDRVDEPTDYGELWYPDADSRDEMRRKYEEMQADLEEGTLSHHVEVPLSGRGLTKAYVMRGGGRA